MRFRRAVVALVAIDLLLVTAYLAHVAVGQPTFKLRELLDLNGEESLAVWYSSIKLFVVASLVTAFGGALIRRRTHEHRRSYEPYMVLALGVLVLAMSIDEVVQFHEWVSARSDVLLPDDTRSSTPFQHTGIWTIVVGIPAAIVFAVVLAGARAAFLPERARFWQFAGGLFLLLTGAVGIETLSNVADEIESTGFRLIVGLEEACELLGATLMFAGIAGRTRPSLVLASASVPVPTHEVRVAPVEPSPEPARAPAELHESRV